MLQISFSVSSANGVSYVPIPAQIGTPMVTTKLAQNFDGMAVGSLPPGWTQTGTVSGSTWSANATVIDSGNGAFAGDVASISDSSLVSPVVTLNSNANQQISFKHRNTTEYTYDGGALEISVNGGVFTDLVTAGGNWVQSSHASNISGSATGNPLVGRHGWNDAVTVTSTVVANLPTTAAGQSVQFRWRMGCDDSTGSTGWYVDTIQVYSTSYASVAIPDGYETDHVLNPNNPDDATLNGDGFSNLQENLAGIDPQNAGKRPAHHAERVQPDGRADGASRRPKARLPVGVQEQPHRRRMAAAAGDLYGGGGGVRHHVLAPADLGGLTTRFYRVWVTGQ